jgi:hypothetical protein
MSEPTPRAEDLEAGLAEIDRRLRQIQDELVGAEPASSSEEGRSSPKRQGRSGPLAAVLQRASRSGSSTEKDALEREEDVRRVEDARAQLDDLERQLQALADLRDKLLRSIRELLDGYQAAAQAQPGAARRPDAATEQDPSAEVTLSVGPFESLEAVRAFERAVATLPGVRETSLRGYEGEDRAIVDVRLAGAEEPGGPERGGR